MRRRDERLPPRAGALLVISPAALAELKARNPVEAVAARYVALRRGGKGLIGACPVCGGGRRATRFAVFLREQAWACAVCTDGGDVIRLVERAEGCDFRGAVARLGGAEEIDPEEA